MKLADLATTPKLKCITIDDQAIVEKYGESVDFWMYDRVNMTTYMKLANLESDDNKFDNIVDSMKGIMLDEDGSPILKDDTLLPPDILVKAVEKAIQNLGNQVTPTTTT